MLRSSNANQFSSYLTSNRCNSAWGALCGRRKRERVGVVEHRRAGGILALGGYWSESRTMSKLMRLSSANSCETPQLKLGEFHRCCGLRVKKYPVKRVQQLSEHKTPRRKCKRTMLLFIIPCRLQHEQKLKIHLSCRKQRITNVACYADLITGTFFFWKLQITFYRRLENQYPWCDATRLLLLWLQKLLEHFIFSRIANLNDFT